MAPSATSTLAQDTLPVKSEFIHTPSGSAASSFVDSAIGSPPKSSRSPYVPESDTEQEGDDEVPVRDDSATALMPDNPFESQNSRILFEAIDQLRSGDFSRYIKTPQLIIVGDQSTGKSSLLQRLTGIPFPVNHECCTRFPTRIVSQRTDPGTCDSFHITIEPPEVNVPGLKRSDADLATFKRTGTTLTMAQFQDVIEEATAYYMNIKPGSSKGSKNFAAEVLKVELSGPNRSYFSITDLPGIFNSTANFHEKDNYYIRAMIAEYMKEPENVVICVLDAPVDLDRQAVVDLANKHASSDRCVGVFTKCDKLQDDPQVAKKIVNRAIGVSSDKILVKMPWFLVRNRAPNDPAGADLDHNESKLFGAAPWTKVSSDRLGTLALRAYLGTLLDSKIQLSFPKIRASLQEQLRIKAARRAELGEARDDLKSREAYVRTIAARYHKIASLSLDNPTLVDDKMMRLRGEITRLEESYTSFMESRGSTWTFQIAGNDCKLEDDMKDLYSEFWTVQPFDSLRQTIQAEIGYARGTVLPGVINPVVYPAIYRQQVRKWTSIAEAHLDRVSEAVRDCYTAIFDSICPVGSETPKLRDGLLALLDKYFDTTLKEAVKDCKRFCAAETEGTRLDTTDTNFTEKLWNLRQHRFYDSIQHLDPKTSRSDDALFGALSPFIQRNIEDDIHDVIYVYYHITIKTFIRNINSIVVESFVAHPEGPIRGLHPESIRRLSEDELNELGEEDDGTSRERQQADDDIVNLRESLKIVNKASQRISSPRRA